MRRLAALTAVLALAAGACSSAAEPTSAEPTAFPLVASSDLGVGEQRFLVALYDGETRSIAAPDLPVELEFRSPSGEISTIPARFLWTIPDVRGIYGARVTFAEPGEWAVVLHPEGGPPTDPAPFLVKEDPSTPQPGEPAPRSDTPTLDDAPIDELTTDPDPDPRFYRLPLSHAVANGRPTVVVFATPAFCQTAICGPTLELVKEESHRYADVDFIHVEVFDLARTPEELVPVPAVLEWGLPSEPWVFVVASDGRVAASFEGTLSAEELEEALAGT